MYKVSRGLVFVTVGHSECEVSKPREQGLHPLTYLLCHLGAIANLFLAQFSHLQNGLNPQHRKDLVRTEEDD